MTLSTSISLSWFVRSAESVTAAICWFAEACWPKTAGRRRWLP